MRIHSDDFVALFGRRIAHGDRQLIALPDERKENSFRACVLTLLNSSLS